MSPATRGALVALGAILLLAREASAQTTRGGAHDSSASAGGTEERAAIDAFEEGRRLFQAGNCAAAIRKLNESLRHYPSVGAWFSLAECLEQADPLAAWRQLKEAERLARSRGDERAVVARSQAAALVKSRLATVRVHLPVGVAGIVVRVDSEGVDPADVEAGIVVAPGTHRVDVSAPNKKAWSGHVAVPVGGIGEETAVLENEPGEAPPPPPAPRPDTPMPAGGGHGLRTVGLAVGGVGAASVVVGAVTAILVFADKHDLQSACGASGGSFPSNCGNGSLSPDRRNALSSEDSTMHGAATASTIAFALGAAGLAAGAVLYFGPRARTAPTAAGAAHVSVGALVAPGTGGIAAVGGF